MVVQVQVGESSFVSFCSLFSLTSSLHPSVLSSNSHPSLTIHTRLHLLSDTDTQCMLKLVRPVYRRGKVRLENRHYHHHLRIRDLEEQGLQGMTVSISPRLRVSFQSKDSHRNVPPRCRFHTEYNHQSNGSQ